MMFKKTLIAAAVFAFGGFALNASAASPATSSFQVTMTINSACTVSTSGAIDFGSVDANSATDQTKNATNISVKCSKGTAYTIGLKPAGGSLIGAGVMAGTSGNGDTLPYTLYQTSGYSSVWGDTVSVNRLTGTTDNAGNVAKTYTVYAKVLGTNLNVKPDTYTDSVAVNVYY